MWRYLCLDLAQRHLRICRSLPGRVQIDGELPVFTLQPLHLQLHQFKHLILVHFLNTTTTTRKEEINVKAFQALSLADPVIVLDNRSVRFELLPAKRRCCPQHWPATCQSSGTETAATTSAWSKDRQRSHHAVHDRACQVPESND